MTNEMMALQGLLEKTSDADLVREMLGFAAARLMELDVGSKTGAALGEKSPDRLAQRNGYRDRVWENAGRDDRAAYPQAAQGLVFPGLFGAAAACREGADGRYPGGLYSRHLDAVGR